MPVYMHAVLPEEYECACRLTPSFSKLVCIAWDQMVVACILQGVILRQAAICQSNWERDTVHS